MANKNCSIVVRQQGVTLVEVMIGIALGLFLLAGLSYLYVGSKVSYGTQNAVAKVQETLRFAFEYLSYDLRMAGYSGCINIREAAPQVVANAPVPKVGLGNSLRGYANGSGWTKPAAWPTRVAGTDVIEISYVSNDCGSNLVAPFSNGSQLFISSNNCGLVDNQVVIVTDCKRADVFRPTFSSSSGKVNVAHGSAQNTQPAGSTCPPGSGKLVTECTTAGNYQGDAFLAALNGWVFYIGINPNGIPSLYRGVSDGSSAPEELAEGVYSMTFQYGLDTAVDSVFKADSYSATPSDWTQVISVEVTLAARSTDDSVVPNGQTYTYNGASVTDRRYRQTLATLIGLRNLVQ